ncbi:MAG: cyclic nucleotide-binding domain-containing protein [Spirochaetes bacterium]|nr:MAG: cyclic nucleotide-binding domain-containing protein [Spirochaetota bacterium]
MSNGPMSQSTSIVTRRYKHGSVVYFENDKSEYIYVLKGGRVLLTSRKVDTGEEVKEEIKPGEFFGVKSSLGKYPREETAQTIGETVLLVLPLADFERLVIQNVNVVRKMLRIFSNQLRRIGKMQREVLDQKDNVNPAEELFRIGEYYFEVGRVQQALYAYKRYMEYYPDGNYSGKAMERIRAIESGSPGGAGATRDTGGPIPTASTPAPSHDDSMDMTDFSIDDDKPASRAAEPHGPMADMDMDSSSGLSGEIDDFFGTSPAAASPAEQPKKDVPEMFYEAMSLFSQESYAESLKLYQEILATKNLKNEAERKVFEKANFEIGRSYLKLAKFNEALVAFSDMIKKFPNSENVKNALFHIGLTYETMKKPDKSVSYYTKVVAMDPKDGVNKLAAKRLATIQAQGK